MEIRRVQSKEGPRQMGTLGCALVRKGGYRLSVAEGEMGFHNCGVGKKSGAGDENGWAWLGLQLRVLAEKGSGST